jgi:eukaryotic-like serine/threonine-protein kinase
MAKSRIGPFALESPLSVRKSTGQMFRGVHIEQRKLAALRIFSIPMGMTPESRQAYAAQLEELKQLRHSNIVRCYGGGFDSRQAFLAYELVEGESLAEQLARRGQLPWETALDYSRQIAEALEFAHLTGWIHGRLRPEKVLLTRAGQVKLADWRREAISSMMDAPPTVRQLQFTAPEVLLGGPADEKADLFSVGAIMYNMLTGNLPFQGRNRQELIQEMEQAERKSPAAEVFDCPVWLNAIVEQLLAKEPRSRPYSVTALMLAFREAEKRQADGVGVLQHATAGFSPLQMKVDREEAEKVLGIKPKKTRRQRESSLLESPLVLGAALLLAIAGIVYFLLPPSEATLRRRAETLLASNSPGDLADARNELQQIVDRFPDSPNAEWAQEKIEWIGSREAERRLDREEREGRRRGEWSPAKTQLADARRYEKFGDLVTALDKYRAIISLFREEEEERPFVALAREGVQRIITSESKATELQTFIAEKLKEAKDAYDAARVVEAKVKLESIIELYTGNKEVAFLVEQAEQQLSAISSSSK